MKKHFLPTLATLALGTAIASYAAPAYATVLTFDDLPGPGSAVPNGYGGFNWNNQATVGSLNTRGYSKNSYSYATVSPVNVIYNWYGSSPVDIKSTNGSAFTYNGAYFTSAWSAQNVSFTGLLNGTVVDTSGSYAINTTSPLWIELDWSGIN